MGGMVLGACTQTPDKIVKAWKEPGKGPVTDLVAVPYYHDADASLAKELGVEIEMDPEANTAFAGSPAKRVEYPHGMSQPGCVVYSASGERLFEWFHPAAFDPKGGKLGNGAVSRVLPEDVVTIVKDKLEGRAPSIAEARIDDQKQVMQKTRALMQAAREAAAKKKAKL